MSVFASITNRENPTERTIVINGGFNPFAKVRSITERYLSFKPKGLSRYNYWMNPKDFNYYGELERGIEINGIVYLLQIEFSGVNPEDFRKLFLPHMEK